MWPWKWLSSCFRLKPFMNDPITFCLWMNLTKMIAFIWTWIVYHTCFHFVNCLLYAYRSVSCYLQFLNLRMLNCWYYAILRHAIMRKWFYVMLLCLNDTMWCYVTFCYSKWVIRVSMLIIVISKWLEFMF